MKYVLVTGWPQNDETAQMEVMDESGSTKICKNPKSKYPLQVREATGVYTEGRMIVCGGRSPRTPKCYSYEDDQQGWTWLANIPIAARYGSSSIQIPGGILVTGGFTGRYYLKLSEIIYNNGTLKRGKLRPKSLPEARYGHCMVEYQGQIFSTGGGDENDVFSDVWSFNNHVEFTLTNKPSMKHTRYFHACGIVHSIQHQDRPLLVMAGGIGDGMDKSEYLDFTLPGAQWQLCSKDLPVQMTYGPKMTTTKNKNQLLMMYEKGIYSFNCRSSDNCYWEKKTSELKVFRRWPVLMKVPASMVENC